MAVLAYARIIGRNRSKVVKPLILGFLAFFLLFTGTRATLFNFLNWGMSGIQGIPAIVLALLIGGMAWDARLTG